MHWKKFWPLPEGIIPAESTNGADIRFVSHEAACLLNMNDPDTAAVVGRYVSDREPAGSCRMTGAGTPHDPRALQRSERSRSIPRDTSYSSVIASSLPIVVHHPRLESRQSALVLLRILVDGSD